MNKIIEWILIKVVKTTLNKLPLQGRGTVFGLLVICLTYLGHYLPAEYLVYVQQIIDFLVGAGALTINGQEIAKIMYDVGSFIAAAGLLRKAFNADPKV